SSETVRQSWYGLALSPEEDHVWWAGGGANTVHTFDLKDGKLSRTSKAEVDPSKLTKDELAKYKEEVAKQKAFKSGLCLDAKTDSLYSLDIDAGTLTVLDPKTGSPDKTIPCGVRPYDVVLGRNQLYVSDWSDRTVLAVDPQELRVVAKI